MRAFVAGLEVGIHAPDYAANAADVNIVAENGSRLIETSVSGTEFAGASEEALETMVGTKLACEHSILDTDTFKGAVAQGLTVESVQINDVVYANGKTERRVQVNLQLKGNAGWRDLSVACPRLSRK